MMLNVWATLWSIFGILFIFSIPFAAFAQEAQQSDTMLSQSQFMQIIDRIDKSEEKLRDYIDTKFKELDTKIDKLDEKFDELDTKIDKLNEDIAFINGQLSIIKWGIAIFGAPLLVGLIIYYLQSRKKRADTTADVATGVIEGKEEPDKDVIQRNLIDNRPPETEIV